MRAAGMQMRAAGIPCRHCGKGETLCSGLRPLPCTLPHAHRRVPLTLNCTSQPSCSSDHVMIDDAAGNRSRQRRRQTVSSRQPRATKDGGSGIPVDSPSNGPPWDDEEGIAQLFGDLINASKGRESDVLASMLDGDADASELSMLAEKLQGMDDAELEARSKSISKFGSLSFLQRTLMEPLALDAIREQLSPEDGALLGKLLVQDEATGDVGTGVQRGSLRRQLLKLKLPEKRRLRGLLSRMQELADQYQVVGEVKDYMDTKLSIRMRRRAMQKGLVLSDQMNQDRVLDDDDEEPGEIEEQEAEDVGAALHSSTADSNSGGSGGRRTWGSSFMTGRSRSSRAEDHSIHGSQARAGTPQADPSKPDEEIAELMSSVLGDGWKEETEGSEDLQQLKALVSKLSLLADLGVQGLDATDLDLYKYLQEVNAAMQEVELMAAAGPQSQDAVVRDSAEFMIQHLLTESDAGVHELELEPNTMSRLAKFVRAAEVMQLYKPFLLSIMQQPEALGLATAAGIDDSTQAMLAAMSQRTRWWLKEPLDEDDQNARQEQPEPHISSRASVVDEEKIEALAAADPVVLRFLGDLLGSGFSDEVMMKYSMHPSLGPKLRSGEWLNSIASDAMPDLVKEAAQEALALE